MCSDISDVTLTEIERMEYRVEGLPPAVRLMLVSFVPSSVNDFFIDVAARFEVTDAHRTVPLGVLRQQRESIS